jgi:PleD family two-component response regulator
MPLIVQKFGGSSVANPEKILRAVATSVGVVEGGESDDLRKILQRAREALGSAANQGRNRVIGHDAHGSPVRAAELAIR